MRKTIFLAAALAFIASACSQPDQTPVQAENLGKLKVNVKTSAATKALVETGNLANGSELGISMLETDGSDYDGFANYKNVKLTASQSGSVQVWTPASDVFLSTTEGTLYAYYPYSTSVTDIKAVPVETDTQTDYMYGTPVPGLSNRNPSADVVMNHALAAVRFNVKRGSFYGTGEVTDLSIKGPAIANAAKMNSITGELSGFSGQNEKISPAFDPFTLSAEGEVKDIIIIPTGSEDVMSISMTIDGSKLEAKASAMDYAEGTITEFTLTVKSKELVIGSVTVTPWGTVNKGSLELEPDLSK